MASHYLDEETIFQAARRMDIPARASYLEQACGNNRDLFDRVATLLGVHDENANFLESPPAAFGATLISSPVAESPGTAIGPYKLLEQIGEGGFGIVYMADQQAPVRRRVALKIIKPGMDTKQVLARFKAELQALSLMDHPNIARALDAGATDSGRPYFVMELVRGVPITDYCDQNNLAVHERLDLFVQVCHAVQHAHQKGIIHRDIKPSNVLVAMSDGRPVPKVIDFGVAKAINQQLTQETIFTRFAEMIGTPLYMSPEQAEISSLDIDTRSDIYSLGVLLYELLTGSTPFEKQRLKQAAFDEIRRIIREEEPPKPSTRISTLGDKSAVIAAHRHADPRRLGQLMRGDLDWIVMKALEKDRTRRYETANGLAMDVQRHLADEPVLAGPPSAMYRFRKFARRNRATLATTALVAVALVAGIVGTTWQWISARDAKQLAEERLVAERDAHDDAERARAAEAHQRFQAEANLRKAQEAVDKYFTTVSESKLLNVPGMVPLRKELLRSALEYYQGFSEQQTDDPTSLADLAVTELRVVQIMYWNGDHENQFFPHMQKGIEILERLVRDGHDTPDVQRRVAGFLQSNPEPPRWEGGSNFDRRLLHDVLLRGTKLWEKFVRDNPGANGFQSDLAGLNTFIADNCISDNRPNEAIPFAERARVLWEKLVKDHPEEPRYRLDLARLYDSRVMTPTGDAAKQSAQKARVIFEELVAEFPRVPVYRIWLASWFLGAGEIAENSDEAELAYYKALEQFEKLAAEFPVESTQRQLATVCTRLGDANMKKGRHADAIPLYRRAVENFETVDIGKATHWQDRLALIDGHQKLSSALAANHQLDLSEAPLRRVIAICEEFYTTQDLTEGESNIYLSAVSAYTELFKLLKDKGRSSETDALYHQSTEKYDTANQTSLKPEVRIQQLRFFDALGAALNSVGRHDAAIETYQKAVSVSDQLLADVPVNFEVSLQLAHRYHGLADALRRAGRPEEAEQADRRAMALQKRKLVIGRQSAGKLNNSAWNLVTSQTQPPDGGKWAVEMAQKAVELEPQAGYIWSTLGTAHYRAGDWKASITALEKSMELRGGGDSYDWFFLAMAHWQLGEKDSARAWYKAARLWTAKYQAQNQEVARFRAEAAALMSLPETTPTDKIDDVALGEALIAAIPRWNFYVIRGRGFANFEQWDRADEDFAKAIELGGKSFYIWYARALVRVAKDDKVGFQAVCADMLKQFWKTDDAQTAHFLAWTCALGPDALAEFFLAVASAGRAAKKDANSAMYAGGLGAILYRAGRLDEARQKLEEADRLSSSADPNRSSPAYNWFFLAMTHHRLGHADEAKQWLDKARQETDKALNEHDADTVKLPWNRRLTLNLLRNEAEALLDFKPTTAASAAAIPTKEEAPVEAKKP